MRILEATRTCRVAGGAERLLAETAGRLRALGHAVRFAFLEEDGLAGGERLSSEGDGFFPDLLVETSGDWWAARGGRARAALAAFGRWVRDFAPDVVHAGNVHFPLLLEAVPTGVPVLRSVHDYRFLCPTLTRTLPSGAPCGVPMGATCFRTGCLSARRPGDALRWSFARYEREAARGADGWIVRSGWMARMMRAAGFPEGRIHLLPLTTDAPEAPPPYPDGDRPMLLFVGRLSEEKSPRALLRVLRDLPESVTLTYVGDGPERARLQREKKAFGLEGRVTLVGWRPKEVVDDLYRRAAAVLMPGAWPEPAGLVGLEAFASARPVVAFDAGGVREWLADGARGRLVPPGDAKGFTEAAAALVAEPARAEAMGREAWRWVRAERGMEAGASDYLAVLERVARGRP